MAWYSRVSKSFSQFDMIHTLKGFSILNETETDIFLKFPCFLYYPVNVGNLISGSSSFSKPSWISGSSWFTLCWSLPCKILSMTLLAWDMSANLSLYTKEFFLKFHEHKISIKNQWSRSKWSDLSISWRKFSLHPLEKPIHKKILLIKFTWLNSNVCIHYRNRTN